MNDRTLYKYLIPVIIIVLVSSTLLLAITVKKGKKKPGKAELKQEQKELDININTFDYSGYQPKKFHKDNNVTCELCHKAVKPKTRAHSRSCSWCHGDPELLVEFTKDMDPNPHDSPHYGPDLECTQCHHQHKKSELFCSQCHNFGYKVQ
jgi:DnaJ-class molecular chaperone